MAFLDWMKRPFAQRTAEPEQSAPSRFKQPGEVFKTGDRVVVYEKFHLGRDLKSIPRHAPGIVCSVYHKGTLVSYERGGRVPANAAIEDVQHATELDIHRYSKDYSALEANIARQKRSVGVPENSRRKTWKRPGPSWER